MCSKGLCCQESIDALNWDPWSTLDWYSIDIWLTPPLILLLDQHLGRQSVKSQLIFAHMPIWVLIDVYESVNTWPTINRLSIKCRSGVDRDVHRVLTKYQSRCPSSVNWDIDQVLLIESINRHLTTMPPLHVLYTYSVGGKHFGVILTTGLTQWKPLQTDKVILQ